MTTLVIEVTRMAMEVPRVRRGRPAYRWTTGYLVKNPDTGCLIYPPVTFIAHITLCKELAGGREYKTKYSGRGR